MTIGQLAPPQLAELLHSLSPVACPLHVRWEWHVLLRLEQLTPSRFDASMRTFMLDSSLKAFLEERVQQRLSSEPSIHLVITLTHTPASSQTNTESLLARFQCFQRTES